MSNRGLGRGFESLIPTEGFAELSTEERSSLRELKLEDIVASDDQPRKKFSAEALQGLADSIREHGVLQPIVVTEANSLYQIVAGERRWRAAKIAGLATIPALVRSLSDQRRMELSLIENVQRENLAPLEIATAYAKLRDQFSLAMKDIAKRVGKSEPAVINTLRLLNLPEEVKQAMSEHNLSEGQVRPLVSASSETIEELLPRIISEGWSARRVEEEAAKRKHVIKSVVRNYKVRAFDEAADKLQKHLSTSVRIRANADGAGDIIISFKDKTEFDKLYKELNKE